MAIAKLREAEKLEAQGYTVAQRCKRLGISDQTFFRWKARGIALGAFWNTPAMAPNHVWSYDFLATRTQDGGALRVLNVVDEFTRRAVGCRVERHIGARDVIEKLEGLFKAHGKPAFIRSDNGREFIAQSTRSWLAGRVLSRSLSSEVPHSRTLT